LPDWQRAFDDPIPLPNGGKLHTLKDAGADVLQFIAYRGAAKCQVISFENSSF
jgi:hypothetical protein